MKRSLWWSIGLLLTLPGWADEPVGPPPGEPIARRAAAADTPAADTPAADTPAADTPAADAPAADAPAADTAVPAHDTVPAPAGAEGTADRNEGLGAAPAPVAAPAKPAAPGAGGRRQALFFVRDPNSTLRANDRTGAMVARGASMMVIPDDEIIVLADAVDYTGDEEGIATLTGNLKLIHGPLELKNGVYTIPKPQDVLTGEIAYIFTKEKRAVVDREVVLVHTPSDPAPAGASEAEKARHDETTLYCDRLTYWYRKGARRALAQPRLPSTQIRFVQKTRQGNAGNARFYDFEDGESETGDVLDLFGGVYGEDDQGQLIEAENARIYLDLDQSEWYNIKRAVVNLEEEEEETPPAEPGAPLPDRPGDTTPTTAPEPGGATPGEPVAAAPAEPDATTPAEPSPAEPGAATPAEPAPAKPAEPAPAGPAPAEPGAATPAEPAPAAKPAPGDGK